MLENLRNRGIIVAVVIIFALVMLVPTIKKAVGSIKGETVTLGDWVSKPINLGLDLSGGVHLIYEVQVDEAVTTRLQGIGTNIRSTLREEKIPVKRAALDKSKNLEVVLLNDRHLDKVKTTIAQTFPTLNLLDTRSEANGAVALTYALNEVEAQNVKLKSVDRAVETIRARVDQFGLSEPLIQKQGETRIILEMPGYNDIESVKSIVGRVAKLEFRLIPKFGDPNVVKLKGRDGESVEVEDQVQMTGDMIDDARVAFDEYNKASIHFELTKEGTKTFAKITGENVGRQLAIILDGIVYSSPNINSKIAGGQAEITGGFQLKEAQDIARILKAGSLPASLNVMEQSLVGPSLGRESIRKSTIAILVGFALVVLFMVFYYRKSGLVACTSLAINIILVCALLSFFGATLTLPGLAGLALTVGMAVDSNVIIFERIKEELNRGVGRDIAVKLGFEQAMSAILDANITTLLIAVVLYNFGTGPVRGFAVTLGIGVVTTLFCATFVTRTFFEWLPLSAKGKELSI